MQASIVSAAQQCEPQTVNISKVETLIAEIKEEISAMSGPLKDGIEVAIGTVQVGDAITMKRRTELTVVFGMLAAIYMLMWLVTGLFGMNIRDTSGTERLLTGAWRLGLWSHHWKHIALYISANVATTYLDDWQHAVGAASTEEKERCKLNMSSSLTTMKKTEKTSSL